MQERHRRLVQSLFIPTLIAIAFAILPTTARPVSANTAPRLKVAATIFPLYDMLRTIAGPTVDVILLVPPGASPHTFAAKPSTIRALAGSAAVFAIGHHFDDWATRLAQQTGVPHTITVDTQITLRTWEHSVQEETLARPTSGETGLSHGHREGPTESREKPPIQEDGQHHGAVDPHYWLTIANAIRMVQTMTDALSVLNPAAKTAYQQRAAAYREQLQGVDNDIRQLLAGLPKRHLATLHPAFGYFAAAYDLNIVATFTSAPGQEPTPRHVQRFLSQIRAAHLSVLFVEPQLPQGPLYSLAHDLGISLKELDPLGGSKDRATYVAMMRFNATQIAASLRE